jgi:hypothetical protein
MAIQSREIWNSGDPNFPATVTMFWDDVSLFITRFIIDNTQGHFPLRAQATVLKNGREFNTTVQPGDTLDQNIPTGQANRLEITVDARGRIDGVDWHIGM